MSIEPELESVYSGLIVLARGDFPLVDKAVTACLEKKRRVWWKFWQPKCWTIDMLNAAEYVIKHRDDKATELKDSV